MTLREFLFPLNPLTDVESESFRLLILLIWPQKLNCWQISMCAKLICTKFFPPFCFFCRISVHCLWLKPHFFPLCFLYFRLYLPQDFTVLSCFPSVFWAFCFKPQIFWGFVRALFWDDFFQVYIPLYFFKVCFLLCYPSVFHSIIYF